MKTHALLLALIALLVIPATGAEPAVNVTMTELIVNPEKFEGKTVRVIGFLHLEFEGNVLYLHKEDFDHALLGNGIWVTLKEDREKPTLSDHYVLLEGKFNSKDHGHMGMWKGALQDIKRSLIWSSQDAPRGKPRLMPLKP